MRKKTLQRTSSRWLLMIPLLALVMGFSGWVNPLNAKNVQFNASGLPSGTLVTVNYTITGSPVTIIQFTTPSSSTSVWVGASASLSYTFQNVGSYTTTSSGMENGSAASTIVTVTGP